MTYKEIVKKKEYFQNITWIHFIEEFCSKLKSIGIKPVRCVMTDFDRRNPMEKVRVCHVFDQIGCHSLWRILDVFLSEFLYKLCIHGLNSSLSVNKFSMIQTGRKIKQSGI